LQAKKIQEPLAQSLRHIDDDNRISRFHLLKICFLQHLALLQAEHGCEGEKARRIIEILRMHSNEDTEPTQTSSVPGRPFSLGGLMSGIRASTSTLDSNALPTPLHMDDSSFIAALCAIREAERTYQPMVEDILQEATQGLGHKLKKMVPELLRHLEEEIPRIVRREIDDRISADRKAANLAAEAQLRSLIRQTLDAEVDHPTNR
jgi:hypothetical protein